MRIYVKEDQRRFYQGLGQHRVALAKSARCSGTIGTADGAGRPVIAEAMGCHRSQKGTGDREQPGAQSENEIEKAALGGLG